MYPKTMIFLAIVGVSLSLLLGLFSVIMLEVVVLLVMIFIGIPTLISQVNVKPKEEEQEQEVKAEEKEILREETIRVSPQDSYYYDFDLTRGDNLKGDISSDNYIDIYFVDNTNFNKWDKDRTFNSEYCNESVLETKIDYVVPKKGTWYLLIENNGRKTAIVKVFLHLSDSN